MPQLMAHVGPAALADWMLHVGGLAAFSTFNAAGAHEGLNYCWEWWLQHITLFDWSRVDLWFAEQEPAAFSVCVTVSANKTNHYIVCLPACLLFLCMQHHHCSNFPRARYCLRRPNMSSDEPWTLGSMVVARTSSCNTLCTNLSGCFWPSCSRPLHVCT